MKAFTLNVDSWHYKLASGFGYDPDFKDHDICAYLRRVLLGMGMMLFFIAIFCGTVFVCSMLLVNMVLGPYFFFVYGLPLNEFAVAGWAIVAASAVAAGIMVSITKLTNRVRAKRYAQMELEDSENYVPPQPRFWKLAYKSYKEKFCARLEFVSNDGSKYETERQKRQREALEQWERDKAAIDNNSEEVDVYDENKSDNPGDIRSVP
jgi:hypothetical protein